jgi:23S rRNA (uracil1939-C5)-methyltransferase
MEQIELRLTGQAYLGRAFGRDDQGRMVFVPFAQAGERVRVQLVETHKRWALGRLQEVLDPASERVEPRCRHFADCGGCHYQHLPYAEQCRVKAQIVRDQLERIGGFERPPVREIVPSASPWFTRNRLQYSLTPAGKLGFKASMSDRVVEIQECYLPDPDLSHLWPRLDLESVPGLRRVALRSGREGELLVVLHADRGPEVEVELDLPASVVWLGPEGPTVLAGDGHLIHEVLGRPFLVSAGSFFQVHTALAEDLVQQAMRALEIQPGDRVYDLYAGVGLFSAFMAELGAHVYAIEESASAVADFEANLDEFEQVELYHATVEQALPALPGDPDAILVDPPRAGLGREVVEAITRHGPKRLVYVSCDPSTLARDSKWLAAKGYRLDHVTPFDFFPQTFHIETLSRWTQSGPIQPEIG